MSYDKLLRHRMSLSRPTRGLDEDGDELDAFDPVAQDVPCYFDRWEAAAVEAANRNDVRRRARLFLAPDAPEVRPGDRIEIEGVRWRAVRRDAVEGPAASLTLVELADA